MRKYLLALLCLMAPAAFASIPDASGVIHGCYNTTNGSQRIIDTAVASCKIGETAIQWNQTGPQGPQGPTGPQGPPGPTGQSGAQNSSSQGHWTSTKSTDNQADHTDRVVKQRRHGHKMKRHRSR